MNLSAPSFFTLSSFSALPFVITLSPKLFATGIAIAPRLPVPPDIKTVSSGFGFIISNACIAVNAVKGTVAASSSDR